MDVFNNNRIELFFRDSSNHAVAPSRFVKDYGDLLFNFIETVLNQMLHETAAVLSGYCAYGERPKIKEIGSFINENQANPKTPVVTYNMMDFEFAFDLFRFASSREPNHFLEVFAKYVQVVYGPPEEAISALLRDGYNEPICSITNEKNDQLRATVAAMLFVVLHECAHTQKDLLDKTIEMFNNSKEFVELTVNLSEEEIKEVACDFIALYEMVSPQCQICNHIETSLNTSATDSYAAGILMQHADALFHLLKYGFSAGNAGDQNLDSLYSQIVEQLHKRCYPLQIALQITEKTSTMPPGDLDIGQAYSYATDLIGDFMRCLGEALQILGKSSTEIIEEQTNNQSVQQDVNEDEIWFRVSLIEKE